MDKGLETHLHFWGSRKIIHAQPLPHPTNYRLDKFIQNFPEFQLCIGWGEGELQDILYCFMRAPRNYRKSRILDCCPKDFYTRHQLVEQQS